MVNVEPRLKADPIVCAVDGCGLPDCGAVGRATSNGHVRGCTSKCAKCRGRRNRTKGRRKQAAAVRGLGIPRSNLSPGHEEFLGGTVRVEVKSGAQVKPAWTRFRKSEQQSEAARAIGDHRPFAEVLMPDGESDGLVQTRLSSLHEFAVAIVEQWGAA